MNHEKINKKVLFLLSFIIYHCYHLSFLKKLQNKNFADNLGFRKILYFIFEWLQLFIVLLNI